MDYRSNVSTLYTTNRSYVGYFHGLSLSQIFLGKGNPMLNHSCFRLCQRDDITQLNFETRNNITWKIPTCVMYVSFAVDGRKEVKGRKEKNKDFPLSQEICLIKYMSGTKKNVFLPRLNKTFQNLYLFIAIGILPPIAKINELHSIDANYNQRRKYCVFVSMGSKS